jgi:hypothetical protein
MDLIFAILGKSRELSFSISFSDHSAANMHAPSSSSSSSSTAKPAAPSVRPPFDAVAYAQNLREKIKRQQTIVFSSIFSPDGLHLVSCNDQGRIAFWHLDTFLVRPPHTWHCLT